MDPVTRFVRSIDSDRGPFFLPHEVASTLEISTKTLDQLRRSSPQLLGPSFEVTMGQRTFRVYNPDDVGRIEAHLARVNAVQRVGARGRRRIWTEAERQDRHRRQMRITYHRGRAELYAKRGAFTKARRSTDRADEIGAKLAAEEEERLRELDVSASGASTPVPA